MKQQIIRKDVICDFYTDSVHPDTLLSQKEAQQILPYSNAWWERCRVFGGGPTFLKIGSRIFYRKLDLLNFINQFKPLNSTSDNSEVCQ